ncbi:hypothetical protein HYH02_005031 [Chlamydomonas schloesseri]|uniref:DUF218 domain-containing protein n=1 Tax=Chlamydomonas schloesseri TaxID=2026947 RepID=A0A836B8F7_9CHLO|nr:hypothetical protein HYH02_005031 [Chlamydomonas schloesseri]|eukprot:KAG2450530.1 hypothetical protein HYH02_005031 [Chlamydomonas schloesseri]
MFKIVSVSAAFGALIAVVLSPAFLRWLHQTLGSRGPVVLPEDAVVDVAIVLGYALFRNGTPTEPLKGRVREGVELYLQGRARNLLFSGAHPGGVVAKRSEANVMREYAEEVLRDSRPGGGGAQGLLAAQRWFEEDKSTSTWENAVFSLDICRQKGWRSVAVVTSPFHQIRSEMVFRRLLREAEAASAARAARAAGAAEGSPPPPIKLYMAPAPYQPHKGWYAAPLDRLVDAWDWARELAALVYYAARDRL